MYKRILVPTDGSERSVKAVEGAARFARPLGATLVVMTVEEPNYKTTHTEYLHSTLLQNKGADASESHTTVNVSQLRLKSALRLLARLQLLPVLKLRL